MNYQLFTQWAYLANKGIQQIVAYTKTSIVIIITTALFSTPVFAQNTAQSGDMRVCGTWVTGTTLLSNINVGNGHVIDAKGTTYLNSMTMNSGGITFPPGSGNAVNFYGTPNATAVPLYCSYSESTPNYPNTPANYYVVNYPTIYIRPFQSTGINIPTDKGFPTSGTGLTVSLEITVNITQIPPYNYTIAGYGGYYVLCNNLAARYFKENFIKTRVNIMLRNAAVSSIAYEGPDGATRNQTNTVELKDVRAGDRLVITVSPYLETGYSAIGEICSGGAVTRPSCITEGETYPNAGTICTNPLGNMNMDINFTIHTKNTTF